MKQVRRGSLLTPRQMEDLTASRLLAYYQKLRKAYQHLVAGTALLPGNASSVELLETMTCAKSILENREHVQR